MKYSFTVNQKAIVESGLDLDLHDACIMAFLNSFALSPKIEKKFIGNKVYCWFQYAHILTNLPLLKMQKDAVYRRLKNLCEFRLLEAHPDNQTCGKAFFHLTELFFDMFFEYDNIPTVSKPYPSESKTVPPTVSKPDYKDIIDKESSSKEEDNGELSLKITDSYTLFIKEINIVSGRRFKKIESVKKQFIARIKEGYSYKDIIQAFKNAMVDKYHVETDFNHLTTEFITRPDKLEKYLNYSIAKKEDKSKGIVINF
jgi:hypothetical protein